jgi:uncharacterized damage-inducible protein DinB
MSEIGRIRDQFERAFHGEAWHGPALLEALEGVTAETATVRPLASAHSIWEITLHLAATYRLVIRRLRGEPARLSSDEDWPPVDATDKAAWGGAVDELKRCHSELLEALAGLDDARLDAPIVEGFSSVYVTLHGLIQHDLYHAGQIVLLEKGG